MRKQVRGFFSSAPVLKCALLLAMIMVRKGGRQEAEVVACLELWGVAGGWGDQQKVGHCVPHRWCKGGLYLMFWCQVHFCNFQDCPISKIIPLQALLTRKLLTPVALVGLVLLSAGSLCAYGTSLKGVCISFHRSSGKKALSSHPLGPTVCVQKTKQKKS